MLTKNRLFVALTLLPAISIIAFLAAYPIIYLAKISFYSFKFGKMTQFVFLGNFLQVLSDDFFWNALRNTIVIVTVSIPFDFLFGLLLALIVNSEIRFKKFFRIVFIIPMILMPIVVGLMWRLMYNTEIGLLNFLCNVFGLEARDWLGSTSLALFSIIVVNIWEWTPFMFLFLLAGLQSIPLTPYEAAKIDGAGRWQIFCYITLPLLKPTIIAVILLRIIEDLVIFDQIFVLTMGGPGIATDTLALYIYRTAFKFWSMGYAASLAIITAAGTIVFALLYTKVFKLEHV